jgi:acetyl esterase/lipase
MTGFFFLLSAFFGWLAYNLYSPNYTHPKWSTVSFLAGWLTAELAIHHIIWQVALVFLFIISGAVTGLFGALGFVICVCSWLAMAYHYMQSDKAEMETADALYDGLGEDYLQQIDEEQSSYFPVSPDFQKIKWPFSGNNPQVEVIKDLPFGDNNQCLDIYRSVRPLENAPVLFQIHGGAWTVNMGSKNEQALPLMNHMAMRNWICVSADYRLSPAATFPEHISDCKEALVWIKEHIESYGGNSDFIVVTGGSAGGHLSALLALSPNDPEFQPGFEDKDTSVQGAVPFYGVYDLTDGNGFQHNNGLLALIEATVMKVPLKGNEEIYRHASPLFRIHENAPPFMVVQGDSDTLVPVEVGRNFADQLRDKSKNAVVYAEISGAQHAFDMFASVRSEHVKHGVERFLAHTYSQYLKSNSGS